MTCLSEAAAQEVVDMATAVPEIRRGENRAHREGAVVVITYSHKMWPYDLADMAGELGLAGDAESAAVFACI